MYSLQKSIKGYKPVACGSSFVILSRGRSIFRADLELNGIIFLCRLPSIRKLDLFPRSRVLERIFRMGIDCCQLVDDELGYVVRNSEIYSLNIRTGIFAHEMTVPKCRKVLSLSHIEKFLNGESWIVFGEYFQNAEMGVVNVWGRSLSDDGNWRIIFSFPAGTINHVHAIISAPELGGVVVLTGDFDEAAGLWLYTEASGAVSPILVGSQEYRSTWLHRHKGQYIYATDSQLNRNSLCKLNILDGAASISRISDIEGSSIYGGCNSDSFFFSTAVEPGAPTGRFFKDVFELEIGEGIRSRNACIYAISEAGQLELIFSLEKDFLPMRLGQFGTFSFPSGTMPKGNMYSYGQAVKDGDDCCLFFKNDE